MAIGRRFDHIGCGQIAGGTRAILHDDLLTQALPDDTSLLNLQLQGLKVTMAGQTTNAAALMQHLSAQPGVRDVRAPSAATKPLGVTKESFSIEFMLDPKTLPSLTGADTKAVEPVVGTAAPASAPVGMVGNSLKVTPEGNSNARLSTFHFSQLNS